MYRELICASALSILILGGTACSRSDEGVRARTREATSEPASTAAEKVAYVRFIDADTHNTDLWFGDLKLFSGVDKNTVTKYKDAVAERHDFELRPAGAPGGDTERSRSRDNVLAKNSEGLSAGKYYTVVAFDDNTKKAEPTLRVVNDDTDAPHAGKAKLRIIHAAPGMEGIEVYAAGRKEKLASESRFTTASTWQEVDPTDTSIEIRTSNDKEGVVRLPNFHLEADKLYTFVVMGGEKNGTKLRVIPIVDTGMRRTRG